MATGDQRLSFQMERFTERDIVELKKALSDINQVTPISYEFNEDGLTVTGLANEPITYTHRKSARAGIDGFMIGYDLGFKCGRFHDDD